MARMVELVLTEEMTALLVRSLRDVAAMRTSDQSGQIRYIATYAEHKLRDAGGRL